MVSAEQHLLECCCAVGRTTRVAVKGQCADVWFRVAVTPGEFIARTIANGAAVERTAIAIAAERSMLFATCHWTREKFAVEAVANCWCFRTYHWSHPGGAQR